MKQVAIAIFAYKRKSHLENLLRSLRQNADLARYPIIVFVDGPRGAADAEAQASVVDFLRGEEKSLRLELRISERNRGLSRSVIEGVSEVFRRYERAIVLEDDLQLSPHCLSFFSECLEKYENQPEVGSITGYAYPISPYLFWGHSVYLAYRASSWGWATWRDRWQEVDWQVSDYPAFARDPRAIAGFNRGGLDLDDMLRAYMEGKIDSWAVRWAYHHYKAKRFCLHPVRALIQNTGVDGSGTHCEPTHFFDTSLNAQPVYVPNRVFFNSYFARLQSLFLNSRFTDLIGRKQKLLSRLLFGGHRA